MKAIRALVLIAALLGLGSLPLTAASPDYVFGPACGMPIIDGVVHAEEWSSASTLTVQMHRASGTPFTATIYVMNGARDLYLGITINDDEFSTYGKWLSLGDGFRIDFDNDYSGAIYAVGDDVLSVNAAAPQFADSFLHADTASDADAQYGGRSDGDGAASRIGELNHFELRHPLCSGDTRDFCLRPGDTVGFRLEYLDAEANGDFGGSQAFPGSLSTSIAGIRIGHCFIADYSVYLPLARR